MKKGNSHVRANSIENYDLPIYYKNLSLAAFSLFLLKLSFFDYIQIFNMGHLTADLKKLIQIKVKPRLDSPSDHYSRLFMVRALLMFTLLTGLRWFQGEVNCIVPKEGSPPGPKVDQKFSNEACWIQGNISFIFICKHRECYGLVYSQKFVPMKLSTYQVLLFL